MDFDDITVLTSGKSVESPEIAEASMLLTIASLQVEVDFQGFDSVNKNEDLSDNQKAAWPGHRASSMPSDVTADPLRYGSSNGVGGDGTIEGPEMIPMAYLWWGVWQKSVQAEVV
jgi:hypothetical protein